MNRLPFFFTKIMVYNPCVSVYYVTRTLKQWNIGGDMSMFTFDPNTPIYIQIMDYVKKDIVTGQLKQGDKLPSVRELASVMQTNPNTVQRALQELEREGIAETRRGTGRYVTQEGEKIMEMKREMSKELIDAYVNGMQALGFSEDEMVTLVRSSVQQREEEK